MCGRQAATRSPSISLLRTTKPFIRLPDQRATESLRAPLPPNSCRARLKPLTVSKNLSWPQGFRHLSNGEPLPLYHQQLRKGHTYDARLRLYSMRLDPSKWAKCVCSAGEHGGGVGAMKSLPVRGIGLLALMTGGAARAAALPPATVYKAPPPVVVAPSWTGFYVGVNGGVSVGQNRTTDTTV